MCWLVSGQGACCGCVACEWAGAVCVLFVIEQGAVGVLLVNGKGAVAWVLVKLHTYTQLPVIYFLTPTK